MKLEKLYLKYILIVRSEKYRATRRTYFAKPNGLLGIAQFLIF